MINHAIQLKDVWKTFNGTDYIIRGISLQIPKGSLTAIIGFSGTGKSVILKHMLGLYHATKGEVIVLGQNMNELSHDQAVRFRKHFGVLFQHAALFDDMTVLENVCFPLIEHRKNLLPDQIIDIAKAKLHQVGLSEQHHEKLPSEISGGMQKRTGLARALALEPDILFYDEPTTGLDPILTEMVDELILTTHKSRPGLTSIMISHDLQAAFHLADFVVMLNAGQVLLSGPPEVFFQSDNELVQKFINKGFKKQ